MVYIYPGHIFDENTMAHPQKQNPFTMQLRCLRLNVLSRNIPSRAHYLLIWHSESYSKLNAASTKDERVDQSHVDYNLIYLWSI